MKIVLVWVKVYSLHAVDIRIIYMKRVQAWNILLNLFIVLIIIIAYFDLGLHFTHMYVDRFNY